MAGQPYLVDSCWCEIVLYHNGHIKHDAAVYPSDRGTAVIYLVFLLDIMSKMTFNVKHI